MVPFFLFPFLFSFLTLGFLVPFSIPYNLCIIKCFKQKNYEPFSGSIVAYGFSSSGAGAGFCDGFFLLGLTVTNRHDLIMTTLSNIFSITWATLTTWRPEVCFHNNRFFSDRNICVLGAGRSVVRCLKIIILTCNIPWRRHWFTLRKCRHLFRKLELRQQTSSCSYIWRDWSCRFRYFGLTGLLMLSGLFVILCSICHYCKPQMLVSTVPLEGLSFAVAQIHQGPR